MKEIVRKEPEKPVGNAVRKVRVEAAHQYASKEPDFYMHLVAELGSDSALEKQLLRVRYEIYGSTPKSRNHLNPEEFFQRVYGDANDIVVLDSNNLKEDWRNDIDRENEDSEYNWDRMSDRLRDIEKEFHSDNDDDSEETETSEETENESSETEPERDLPKRVLAFTSESLLSQLGRGLKTSVDGTFKSSCSLWRQMFVWMVKDRGYWIPVVFAWLPDKSETSYKVFFHMVLQKLKELNI